MYVCVCVCSTQRVLSAATVALADSVCAGSNVQLQNTANVNTSLADKQLLDGCFHSTARPLEIVVCKPLLGQFHHKYSSTEYIGPLY